MYCTVYLVREMSQNSFHEINYCEKAIYNFHEITRNVKIIKIQ